MQKKKILQITDIAARIWFNTKQQINNAIIYSKYSDISRITLFRKEKFFYCFTIIW